jgi:hypothetical protein
MNKTLFSLIVVFISLNMAACKSGTDNPTQTTTTSIDLTTGLKAHYSFENNAQDTSGNSKNGSLFGTYSFVDGKQGKGIRLVGDNTTYHTTGGYIQIPQIDTTNLTGLTISVWVKEDSLSTGDGYIFLSSDYEQGWCGIGHFGTFVQYAVGSNKATIAPLSIEIGSTALGQWTLYTLVYSNNSISAYINGQLKGLLPQNLHIYGSLATLGSHSWGGSYSGSSTHFTGIIDEVRIYNRALDSDAVQALYQLGQ